MSGDDFDRSPESVPKGDDEMLTVMEAAKALGVSRGTLYHMMDEGVIFPIPVSPHLKRPMRHLFTRAEVDRVAQEDKRRAQARGDH